MRWIVLANLPPENLKSDPAFDWAIHPQFCRVEWVNEDDRLIWSVSLLHRHWNNSLNPDSSSPDMVRCKLSNREQVMNNKPKAFPEYECGKCGKEVPYSMVKEKIERQRSLKGIDPRNDRRGAVLATRRSNLTDPTKES